MSKVTILSCCKEYIKSTKILEGNKILYEEQLGQRYIVKFLNEKSIEKIKELKTWYESVMIDTEEIDDKDL